MLRSIFTTFFVISFFACLAQPSNQEIEIYVDKLAENQLDLFKVPGLAIGIINNGSIIYQKAIGVQSLQNQTPLTTKSLFHMASVSKPFVATALVIAEAEGLLKLDDLLTKHLPYFKMASPGYKQITLRHMLSHTSGIPDVEDYDWGNPDVSDEAIEAYSRSMNSVPLDFEPGSDFSYSNAAFDLLADVIMKASGMTFESYLKSRIFQPAGMHNSSFSKNDINNALATASHIPNNELTIEVNPTYPYNRIHAPSSSLHSNIEDMLQWGQLYLNAGTINNEQLFTKTQYAALTNPEYKRGKGSAVCLSWFKAQAHGHDFFNHSGGDPGYSTYFGFMPEKGFAVAVMANNDIVRASHVAAMIIGYVLKGKERTWPKPPVHLKIGKVIIESDIEALKKAWYHEKESNIYDTAPNNLDDLGYRLIDGGYYSKAVDVFKFLVELEPKEGGWHDSVGDAYRAWGKSDEANAWYKKALEKGFEGSRTKIKP